MEIAMLKRVLLVTWAVVVVATDPLLPTPVADETTAQEPFLLPDMPKKLEDSEFGTFSLVYIWNNRLFQHHKTGGILRANDPERSEPATFLIPDDFKMINLVPQDAPHPLYSDQFSKLTDNFLLDSMSSDPVDLNDPKLTSEGKIIKSRKGSDLLFKKDAITSQVSVNGISVLKVHKIDDTLTVFVIDGIPFNYEEETDKAFQVVSRDAKPFFETTHEDPKIPS